MDTDKLERLFDLQKRLNKRIGVDTDQMTSEEEKTRWVLQYCRALSQEIAELTDSVPWKWWAKYQTFDAQNAAVEVVDMLHFVISLAQVLGLSADTVFQMYTLKHQINLKRQEDGYTVKDANDCKVIT